MTFEQLQQHFRKWVVVCKANHPVMYKVDRDSLIASFQWTRAMRTYVLSSGVYKERNWHYDDAPRIYSKVVLQELVNAETRSSNL